MGPSGAGKDTLWFDVGIKRYTTNSKKRKRKNSCGLMQESKDIQQTPFFLPLHQSCGLMQESKDIQQRQDLQPQQASCGLMQESKDIQRWSHNKKHKKVVV